MAMSTKVQIPSLVSTMLTCQQKELRVAKEAHVVILVPHENQHFVQW
jgi:hypothetical protein